MSSALFDVIVRELRHGALAAAVFVAIAPNIVAHGPDGSVVHQESSRDDTAIEAQADKPASEVTPLTQR